MSVECDIAEKIVRKKQLQAQIKDLNEEIKADCEGLEKSFAVEYEGNAVTVKPQKKWRDGESLMPITTVVPLVDHCETEPPIALQDREAAEASWPAVTVKG